MYSIKEKMKLLRELYNPEHADADLRLLREVSPHSDLLKSPIVCAARAAEKILYSLLDHATADRIRLNRRGAEVEKQTEKELKNENSKEELPTNAASGESASTEQPAGNTSENPGEDHPDGDAHEADVEKQLQETAEELDETCSELEDVRVELEDVQGELDETKAELEDTQAELETTKEELEAEKKSEPVTEPAPESSKKKTSTRKSTGKTSSTKTSRSRRSSTTTE